MHNKIGVMRETNIITYLKAHTEGANLPRKSTESSSKDYN